jgi:dienelactone hydrolase
MSKHVFLLLGGMQGPDGFVDSRGMLHLKYMLNELPDTRVMIYTWDAWRAVLPALAEGNGDKRIIIGYSGGGSRATWLAIATRRTIDLLVAYDPSPIWEMRDLPGNVKKAICYHNSIRDLIVPFVGQLGGGHLAGIKDIETVEIEMPHLLVQEDIKLHQHTVDAVRAL